MKAEIRLMAKKKKKGTLVKRIDINLPQHVTVQEEKGWRGEKKVNERGENP